MGVGGENLASLAVGDSPVLVSRYLQSFSRDTYCFQVCPSDSKLYSMRTWSVPLTAAPSPSSWPKLPKTLARTHHWPEEAPHQELLGQLSRVAWIKSPVPLDIYIV